MVCQLISLTIFPDMFFDIPKAITMIYFTFSIMVGWYIFSKNIVFIKLLVSYYNINIYTILYYCY